MNYILNFIVEYFDILTLLFVFVLSLSICHKSIRFIMLLFFTLTGVYTVLAILYNYGYGSKRLYDWSIEVIVSFLMIFKFFINIIHSSPLHFIHCENLVGVFYILSQCGFELILSIKSFNISYKFKCLFDFCYKKIGYIKNNIEDNSEYNVLSTSFNFVLRI